MCSFPTPEHDTLELWYKLGELYAGAADDGRRAFMRGFATVCVTAALVLLSAPLLGTSWAGPFAPVLPVLTGLLVGAGSFGWSRMSFLTQRNALGRALAKKGEDLEHPTTSGLGAYYDTQLVLLRCEYEFLHSRGTRRALRSAKLFECSFGFTPEDPFECGPLNVRPDTDGLRALRERWEKRLAVRRTLESPIPALGLREDLAYRVFPREMTVPLELATQSAYLEISCKLLRERYGKALVPLPEELRERAERDLRDYRAIARR